MSGMSTLLSDGITRIPAFSSLSATQRRDEFLILVCPHFWIFSPDVSFESSGRKVQLRSSSFLPALFEPVFSIPLYSSLPRFVATFTSAAFPTLSPFSSVSTSPSLPRIFQG